VRCSKPHYAHECHLRTWIEARHEPVCGFRRRIWHPHGEIADAARTPTVREPCNSDGRCGCKRTPPRLSTASAAGSAVRTRCTSSLRRTTHRKWPPRAPRLRRVGPTMGAAPARAPFHSDRLRDRCRRGLRRGHLHRAPFRGRLDESRIGNSLDAHIVRAVYHCGFITVPPSSGAVRGTGRRGLRSARRHVRCRAGPRR
jgi:hypothetical protein